LPHSAIDGVERGAEKPPTTLAANVSGLRYVYVHDRSVLRGSRIPPPLADSARMLHSIESNRVSATAHVGCGSCCCRIARVRLLRKMGDRRFARRNCTAVRNARSSFAIYVATKRTFRGGECSHRVVQCCLLLVRHLFARRGLQSALLYRLWTRVNATLRFFILPTPEDWKPTSSLSVQGIETGNMHRSGYRLNRLTAVASWPVVFGSFLPVGTVTTISYCLELVVMSEQFDYHEMNPKAVGHFMRT